jgi:molybdopterin-guanine dinucleotide biosynthesis protein A
MMTEGVLLTGGASRRMGSDKSRLMVGGEPIAIRTARLLSEHCSRVTVLGRFPVAGHGFLEDQEDFAGPLNALARFIPNADTVFVASCDMPLFDGRMVPFLISHLESREAVMPFAEGHLQPLCAVYSADAWNVLARVLAEGQRSIKAWLERLQIQTVDPEEFARVGIDPRAYRGANSPEELESLLGGPG